MQRTISMACPKSSFQRRTRDLRSLCIPFPDVSLKTQLVPLPGVVDYDQDATREDAFPQLDEPALWLREPVQEVNQYQVVPFQLVWYPCHLEGVDWEGGRRGREGDEGVREGGRG